MNAIELFKEGSKIHIKKKNRGKFTAYCGGNVTSACIAKAKASGNPTLVKRATFAANARKWKHLDGGILKGQFGLGIPIITTSPKEYLDKGAELILKGLEPLGKIVTSFAAAPLNGATSYTTTGQYRTEEKAKELKLKEKAFEETVGPALSPSNHVVAWTQGSWNPKVGQQKIMELGPLALLGSLVTDAAAFKYVPKGAKAFIKSKKATSDTFVDFLSLKTGKKITRKPISAIRNGDVYSHGYSYFDNEGNLIAHIGGTKRGNNVFVESSFVTPKFRSLGIGKQMYFDFNLKVYNELGTTLHSSPYQHQTTLEISPGVFISPTAKMWGGLKQKGQATLLGKGLDKYYVMDTPEKIYGTQGIAMQKFLPVSFENMISLYTPEWIKKNGRMIGQYYRSNLGGLNNLGIKNSYIKLKNFLTSKSYKDRLTKYYTELGYSPSIINEIVNDLIGKLLYNIETAKARIVLSGLIVNEDGTFRPSAGGMYSPTTHTILVELPLLNTTTPIHEMIHSRFLGNPGFDNNIYKMNTQAFDKLNRLMQDSPEVFKFDGAIKPYTDDISYYGHIIELEPRVLNTLIDILNKGIDINNLTLKVVDNYFDRPIEELPIDTLSLITNYRYDDLLKALRNFKSLAPYGISSYTAYKQFNKKKEGGKLCLIPRN